MLLSGLVEHLPSIITALGTIILGWFTYNQYTKNKLTDVKIEQWKLDSERNRKRDAGSIATCFGCLWELLHYLKAGRVYLIQPHPLAKTLFISATLEVKRNGITSVKDNMSSIPVNTIAEFVSKLANEDYIYIDDIESADIDKKMKSIMMYNGCQTVAIRRLMNNDNKWVGNIVVGFPEGLDQLTVEESQLIEKMTRDAAQIIQGILPEFME